MLLVRNIRLPLSCPAPEAEAQPSDEVDFDE